MVPVNDIINVLPAGHELNFGTVTLVIYEGWHGAMGPQELETIQSWRINGFSPVHEAVSSTDNLYLLLLTCSSLIQLSSLSPSLILIRWIFDTRTHAFKLENGTLVFGDMLVG
jgi:hypothetical protein